LETLEVCSVASHIFLSCFVLYSFPISAFLPLLNVEVSFLCSTCWNYRCLCEVGGGFPACTILHFSSLKFICFQSRSSEVSPEFLATRPYAHTDRWLSFSRFHVLALELLLQIVLNLLNTVGPSTDSGGISVSCPFLFFLPAFYACEDFISCFKTAWLPYESLLSNSQLPLGVGINGFPLSV